MIQPKINKRASTRIIQLLLDSLQHILVLLAFVMFFSYIQVATAQSVVIQPEPINQGASYLNLIIGMFSLGVALIVKHISKNYLSRSGYQVKEYI